jgi:hypothetical protein
LIASRRTLTDELTLAAVSRFLSEYVAVVGLVRSTGGHLAGDAKSLDELLVSLLRQVLLMAQRAQRTIRDEAIARRAAPERVEGLLKNRSDVLRGVDRLTAGLAGARSQALGVAPHQLTRTLGPPLTAVGVLVDKLRTEAQGW